ncbi:MAG TPA: SUMF1/EgtB/PvdO family nonheme iron enzyme [Polyangiaceae bacterium]|nr:SUMF1/EgtB/PvdO family nonheme iron enzyme [Polyangiaceae bacterium]
MARARWHAVVLPLLASLAGGCRRAQAGPDGRPEVPAAEPAPAASDADPAPPAANAATAPADAAGEPRAPSGEAPPAGGRDASAGPPFLRRPGEGTGPPAPGPDGGPAFAPDAPPPAVASGAAEAPASGGGPCPDDMVLSGSACVDRYEAFLVQVGEAGADLTWPHYQRPRAGVAYAARNAAGASPQAYISRHEAEAACKLAGKRLCTLHEWQRACQGKRQMLFPYGRSYQKGACNSGKPHLLSMFFGRDGYAWKYEEHFNSPLLDQQPGYLAKAGEYAACASDEGTHDMVGNLHEWVADPVDRLPFDPGPSGAPARRRPMTRVGNGIFMGGFFSTTDQHGAGCTFITTAHEPAYHDYSVGFRCCRDPGAPR